MFEFIYVCKGVGYLLGVVCCCLVFELLDLVKKIIKIKKYIIIRCNFCKDCVSY